MICLNIFTMKLLQPYRVIKSSTDGTFLKDDIIWMSSNGDICSKNNKGFLPFDEQNNPQTIDFKIEIADNYYIIKESNSEILKIKDE